MVNIETEENGCYYENNMPEESCRFLDDRNVIGRYASLMYKQFLDYVRIQNIFLVFDDEIS